jgi:integrase/recombinase XerD
MLTIYRRHKKTCAHRLKGRAWRRCACPYWVDGTFAGIEIRESLRVNTGEDAERELEALKRRLEQPSDNNRNGPTTLSSAWDQFTADCKSRQLREPTLNKYRYLRNDMERFAAGEGLRFVAEFNLETLGNWRASWPNRNLSAVKKLELVRCFLRFAHDRGWIPDNPARKLKSPKVKAKQTLPFTRDEVANIIGTCDSLNASERNRRRLRALALLLRHSGLRIGDAVTLSRDRINNGKLFLYTSKAGTHVSCPLPPFVLNALDAAIHEGERFYFWTGNGKPKSAISDWQEKLKDLCNLAKVANGHAHRFRDTFATELLLAGVPLERVSILLGHSSIRITERHYSPWVRARQEQLERDVRSTWAQAGVSDEGTSEVHGANNRPN